MKYTNFNFEKNSTALPEKKGISKLFIILLFTAFTVTAVFLFREKIKTLFDPISIVGSVAAAELKETDGRTNILLLGSDKREKGAENNKPILTDTILIASIGSIDKDVVLISVPRDMWIKWTTDADIETYSKINAIYDYTTYQGSKIGGIDNLEKALEEMLGIELHYYAVITFELFNEVVDTLGGIEVNVDNTFTDYFYPIEGKENAPENERYETITFEAGLQTMDGDTALKFTRSRKGNNNEGTDFARAKRQQKIITAIKNKVLSVKTLLNPIKLKELYHSYKDNVDTDIDLGTIQSFYLLSQQIDFNKVVSIVLDDRSQAVEGGLLYAPEDNEFYGGQYVLLPQTGDYSQIHAYVKKYLYGDK